ncbi:hypothetical protein EBB07_04810 [Paenibacillaceae bacterium]|nr:hypothetical protein EBB07_04810 [Paenibacillaceae bacterium]
MSYIALDVGSSYIKLANLNVQELSVTHIRTAPMPEPLAGVHPLRKEWDMELLYRRIAAMLDEQLESCVGECQGIWITTQMHGFVLADELGQAVTSYINWQDERGLEPAAAPGINVMTELMGRIGDEAWLRTGLWQKPGIAAVSLYHMLNYGDIDAVIGRTYRGLQLCTLGGYVILRLTGQHVCHLTNAVPTGLADLAGRCWDQSILNAVGCQGIALPRIESGYDAVGEFHSKFGIIPVFPDIGDHQAAFLGSLAHPEEEVVMNIGTAGWLSQATPSLQPGAWETRPYFEERYLATITKLPGGRNLAVLVDFIRSVGHSVFQRERPADELWEHLLREAERTGTDGLRSEVGYWGPQTGTNPGAIWNIHGANLSAGSILASAMNEIALTYSEQFKHLAGGRDVRRIIGTGGVLMKNGYLRREIERQLSMEIVPAPLENEVFLGLLRLALIYEGKCANVEQTRTLILSR